MKRLVVLISGNGFNLQAILDAGGQPVALPFHDRLDEGLPPWIDALLLTGGNDADPTAWGQPWHPAAQPVGPDRERHERRLLQRAHEQNLPVLGICFGAQLMNIVRGIAGRLTRAFGRVRFETQDRGVEQPGSSSGS